MSIFSRLFEGLFRQRQRYHVGRHIWTGPKDEIFEHGTGDCAKHRVHNIEWETRFGERTEEMLGGDLVLREAGRCEHCGAIIIRTTNGAA
jgi:hypothetical protein